MTITYNHAKRLTPIDAVLGRNLKIIRIMKGLSQTELGDRTGISFQQIGKYEGGTNRLSASRLVEMADILDCNVMDFFENITEPSVHIDSIWSRLQRPSDNRIINAFQAIRCPKQKAALLAMAETMAEAE